MKAAKDGTLDEAQAAETMQTLEAIELGDRTEWIAKADAALASVKWSSEQTKSNARLCGRCSFILQCNFLHLSSI